MKTIPAKVMQAVAILRFYKWLQPNFKLPKNVEIMNPFTDAAAWKLTATFYNKFYNDDKPRRFIFGINPGRFGGGVTGIPFTDSIRLQQECGIENGLPKKAELSSQFIYQMINGYGGTEAFYGQFFITALSPLGFTKNGINLNYYDDKELLKACEPFIIACIREQMATIPTTNICYCLGEGTNFKYFSKLNSTHQFFKEIIPLPHPRWIMQYRRKRIDEFVKLYVDKLKN